jgi:hypothetical protein
MLAERREPSGFGRQFLRRTKCAMLICRGSLREFVFPIDLFCWAMWRGSVSVPAENIVAGESPTGENLPKRFAMRFAIVYWVLYLLPGPFPGAIVPLGINWLTVGAMKIAAVSESLRMSCSQWVAGKCFGLNGPLVPKNGSGDTTGAYLEVLEIFVVALVLAAIWSLIVPDLQSMFIPFLKIVSEGNDRTLTLSPLQLQAITLDRPAGRRKVI